MIMKPLIKEFNELHNELDALNNKLNEISLVNTLNECYGDLYDGDCVNGYFTLKQAMELLDDYSKDDGNVLLLLQSIKRQLNRMKNSHRISEKQKVYCFYALDLLEGVC